MTKYIELLIGPVRVSFELWRVFKVPLLLHLHLGFSFTLFDHVKLYGSAVLQTGLP